MAIAAFVLGLVSLLFCPIITAIIGLVLAAKAHGRINQSGGTLGGRGLATAGRVLSIVGLVVWVPLITLLVVVGVSQRDNRTLNQIEAGDCFDIPSSRRVNHIVQRSCADDHDAEAVSVVVHPAGRDASYPGARVLATFAAERCPGDFERYVGRDARASRYTVSWLFPLEGSWTGQHVRRIVCVAVDPEGGKLATSVQGTSQ